MKKNVIVITIDGCPYEMFIDRPNHKSPAKFLNDLKEKSISSDYAYSQGPYTEAAIMGLFYGHETMNNGGYLTQMLRSKNNILQAVQKDYKTFVTYQAGFMHPSLLHESQYIYNLNHADPCFSRFLKSKTDYFYDLYCKGALKESDLYMLNEILEAQFGIMMYYRSPEALKNDYGLAYNSYCFVSDRSEWEKKVLKEYHEYREDRKVYIQKFLNNYYTHFLTTQCSFNNVKMKPEVINQHNWFLETYQKDLDWMKKQNCKYNIKNNLPPLKNTLQNVKYLAKGDIRNGLSYFAFAYQNLFDVNISKNYRSDLNQVCTSTRYYIDNFCDWISNQSDFDKPFFGYLHLDEFHVPLSFITHDTAKKSIVEKEMEAAIKYVEDLTENYRGNVFFDLSLRYIDSQIERLFHYLNEKNLLQDTTIIITADHGIGNFGMEYRYTRTNNFYKETYHIPFIIYNCDKQQKVIDTYIASKDIGATILDLCDVEKPESFTGTSIFSDDYEQKEYTMVEYMGSGVPDMTRRPVCFAYRDDNMNLVYKVKLEGEFESGEITELYDLQSDPHEYKNIVKKAPQFHVEAALSIIRKRYEALQKDYQEYRKKIRAHYEAK